ncbi:MAG: hypothetical protein HY075_05115, partial [Deltaproteobacteria bacterium]|nr:hypothetical protein [Deltaproteobacteria bacterium]
MRKANTVLNAGCVVVALCLALGAMACKDNGPAAGTGSGGGGGAAGGGGATIVGTVGTTNNLGFYVQPIFANSNVKYYFHEQTADPITGGSFTCNVPVGSPAVGM